LDPDFHSLYKDTNFNCWSNIVGLMWMLKPRLSYFKFNAVTLPLLFLMEYFEV